MSKHQKQTNDSGASDAASDETIVKMTIVSPLAPSEIVIFDNHCSQWQEFGQKYIYVSLCMHVNCIIDIKHVLESSSGMEMNWYLTRWRHQMEIFSA